MPRKAYSAAYRLRLLMELQVVEAQSPPVAPAPVAPVVLKRSAARGLRNAAILGLVLGILLTSIWGARGDPIVVPLVISLAVAAIAAGFAVVLAGESRLTLQPDALEYRNASRSTRVAFRDVRKATLGEAHFLGGASTGFERRLDPHAAVQRPGLLVLEWEPRSRLAIPLGLFRRHDADRILQSLAAAQVHVAGSPFQAAGRSHVLPSLPAFRRAGANHALAIVAGVASATGGALAWGLLLLTTGFEVGIIASLIGALCGYAVFIGSGRVRSVACGAIALSCAFVGTVLGKFLGVAFIAMKEFAATGDTLAWDLYTVFFFQNLGLWFNGIDLLFFALAFYAAWRIAGPPRVPKGESPAAPPPA